MDLSEQSPFTICVECKWFQTEGKAIWYNQYCGNPRREKKKVIDFVTGKESFSGVNDLGGSYKSEERRPHAREINTDGMCETFEVKGCDE